MNRIIGLDIHKRFAEVAVLRPGRAEPQRLRFPAEPGAIRAFAARLGPDEFGIILTNTLKTPASAVAQRFRAALEAYPYYGVEALPGKKLPVSMGVATFPDDAAGSDELASKANAALRNAKAAGGGLRQQGRHRLRGGAEGHPDPPLHDG